MTTLCTLEVSTIKLHLREQNFACTMI